MEKNEIILYTTEDSYLSFEVKFENETVWLTQKQMAELFDKGLSTVKEHIINIYDEKELLRDRTSRNFRLVQKEGNRTVVRDVDHYNLDVIISVGYRVKSKRGTQFRIWANQILKDYLIKGYALNHSKLNNYPEFVHEIKAELKILKSLIEEKDKKNIEFQIDTKEKLNEMLQRIEALEPPKEEIFFENQEHEAYDLLRSIFKKAKQSIVIVDTYINNDLFALLKEINKDVKVLVFTSSISEELSLALKKYNVQYKSNVEIKKYKDLHDRYLIIDEKLFYHIGHSIKDLGKKMSQIDLIKTKKVKDELKNKFLKA